MIQDDIQNEAVDAWEGSGYVGTLNLGVGAGKTFCAYKAMYRLQEKGLLTKDDLVLVKAERSNRWENTFVPEAKFFNEVYGKNPLEDFQIDFFTYQANIDIYAKFIIYDEIHDALTQGRYYQLVQPECYKLGLTGTPNEQMYVFPDKAIPKLYMSSEQLENKLITDQTTKGNIYQCFCPIVYTKTEKELIDLEVLSPFETIIIRHSLDPYRKNCNITKNWKVSEREYWTNQVLYTEKLFEQAYSIEIPYKDLPDDAITATQLEEQRLAIKTRDSLLYKAKLRKIVQMPKFLYKLKSKVNVVKQLLNLIDTPTILFSVEKELLWELTENVVDDKKDAVRLVSQFNTGEIDVIATSKALQQGVTLKGLQNIILVTFQSSSGQLIQTIGRVIRRVEGKVGRVYIIVAKDTYEEKWLTEMQKVKDSKGRKTRKVNLNVVAEIESDCITKESLRL